MSSSSSVLAPLSLCHATPACVERGQNWTSLLLVYILLHSNTEHLRFSFTYRANPCTRQLSNSVQNSPYIHQHIPRKRLQASSCYYLNSELPLESQNLNRWAFFKEWTDSRKCINFLHNKLNCARILTGSHWSTIRQKHDVIIGNFFPLFLKVAESFENLEIFCLTGRTKTQKKSCRGCGQVPEAGRRKKNAFLKFRSRIQELITN